ncbi:MAG: hypothetical protein HZB57_06510 [Gammaproteobacteria bacterium]|nr:hypothetical protein [Gammaproteobacteria bacterium]
MNRFIIVLGPWGSGSTAVTGILDHLGAFTCPPHFKTNDPRTPSAYESEMLRNILLRHIDEQALMVSENRLQLVSEIQQWLGGILQKAGGDDRVVVLKHALLSLIMPELVSLLHPKFIIVRRSYTDIERTRVRRQWPPIYGYLGARIIYDRIYSELVANSNLEFLDVYMPDILSHPDQEISRIADFSGLGGDPDCMKNARTFLRC